MTETETFNETVARLTTFDPNFFLGKICWYTVTDAAYMEHTTFCADLLSAGLQNVLPSPPRSSDVFKRACTAAQQRRVVAADGTVENVLIREVGKDHDNVWRHIVVEKVDPNGRTLSYDECVELHFNRTSEQIEVRELSACAQSATVQNTVNTVLSGYRHWYNMITPYRVRETIRFIVRSWGATVLRDGVYFVPREHFEDIERLETMVNDRVPGSNFHSLPLIDDRQQRAMLRQSFEDESVGEIDSLLGLIRDIRTSNKRISSDRFADLKVQYDKLKEKASDYSFLLDDALGETNFRLEMMDKALFELMGQIKI